MTRKTNATVGRPVGTKNKSYQPWVESDWVLIRDCLSRGLTQGKIHPFFPTRTLIQVQNAIRIERCRQRGICICGKKLEDNKSSCTTCRTSEHNRLLSRLAKGLCPNCNNPLDGGSVTLCIDCATRKREKHYIPAKVKALKKLPIESSGKWPNYNILNWLGSKSTIKITSWWPTSLDCSVGVVDLFGGSGQVIMALAHAGAKVVAYNDLHPGLINFFNCVVDGDIEELIKSMKVASVLSPDELVGLYDSNQHGYTAAGIFYNVSKNVKGQNMSLMGVDKISKIQRTDHIRKMLHTIRRGLADVGRLNMDFADVIDNYDLPGVVFFVDPPWTGKQVYEYGMVGRHRELTERLLALKHANFIGTFASSRDTIVALKGMQHLYWKICFGGFREIVASSQPLVGVGQPIDMGRYGL